MVLPVARRAPLAAVAPSAASIHERAASVLRSGEYQAQLPTGPSPFRLDLPIDPILFLVRAALAAAVVVAVVLAATWLVRRLRGGAEDVALPSEGGGEGAAATIPIGAASELAAAGRFADAIHVLLLEALQVLSRAARLAPSLTSREIVQRVPLAPPARDALGGLVAAVEISHFGGATPGEPEYQACLARFHVVVGSHRSAA